MTAATSGRSSGDNVSFSTIDAMIKTSYGVRFLERAYLRSTRRQFSQNVVSCSCTSSRFVVFAKNSYEEVDAPPVLAERRQLLLHELAVRRLREELVRRWKEKTLHRARLTGVAR